MINAYPNSDLGDGTQQAKPPNTDFIINNLISLHNLFLRIKCLNIVKTRARAIIDDQYFYPSIFYKLNGIYTHNVEHSLKTVFKKKKILFNKKKYRIFQKKYLGDSKFTNYKIIKKKFL